MTRNEAFIPDHIRSQLLTLGIPSPNHLPEVLAEFFPREFNIRSAGLTAEDLARVLVHLAGQGIISIDGASAGNTIKNVEPGWHSCQFYRDFKQLVDMVAPYIAEGLENGEGCLWVLPDAVTARAASSAIGRSVKNVDAYLASGQLELLHHPDWYLDASGRLKSFEQIAEALLGRQDRALERGFKFLRAAGDTGWVSGTEQSKEFIAYELKVNAALRTTKVAAVCTYRADVTADELVGIVGAHQDAIYKAPAC